MNAKSKIFTSTMLLCALVSACLFAVVAGRLNTAADASVTPLSGTVIVIDAGHGAFDPGASFGGYDEKDINLVIAKKLHALFVANGFSCVMTREADVSTCDEGLTTIAERKRSDIRNRVALAESYTDSVLISIHQNSYSDPNERGAQVFYGIVCDESKPLAEFIQAGLKSVLQPDNRREVKRGTESIYILKATKRPTVLVECGFMSSPRELEMLTNDEYCEKIATAIFCAYTEYLSYTNTAKE